MAYEAQKNKNINYLKLEKPLQATLDIVKIVSVYPPTSEVKSFITTLNKVSSCRRKTMKIFLRFSPVLEPQEKKVWNIPILFLLNRFDLASSCYQDPKQRKLG